MAINDKPSTRGELEISTLNNMYLKQDKLKVLGRRFAWLDIDTMDSLMESVSFFQTV
jgi:glucose-1-phosphate thymidylyltransferase